MQLFQSSLASSYQCAIEQYFEIKQKTRLISTILLRPESISEILKYGKKF